MKLLQTFLLIGVTTLVLSVSSDKVFAQVDSAMAEELSESDLENVAKYYLFTVNKLPPCTCNPKVKKCDNINPCKDPNEGKPNAGLYTKLDLQSQFEYDSLYGPVVSELDSIYHRVSNEIIDLKTTKILSPASFTGSNQKDLEILELILFELKLLNF